MFKTSRSEEGVMPVIEIEDIFQNAAERSWWNTLKNKDVEFNCDGEKVYLTEEELEDLKSSKKSLVDWVLGKEDWYPEDREEDITPTQKLIGGIK